ncbi:POK9 protein, partial [Chloropsis cyanopogon]|nr:POK9 protein [Chloropsis cyanopogon]
GSLGVDVATAIEVTLQDKQVTLIPTDVFGPMYSTTSLTGGLLVGRSPTSKQGVIVIPGIIDTDYTGHVKIMAYALQPPVTIPKGSKIAKIIAIENFLPHRTHPREQYEKLRGSEGFGSTGHDVFFTLDPKSHPHKKIQLQRGSSRVQLEPMLDTGADVTIIS